ncbi:MAG: PrgI family protein [Pseudonocardiaceae bacterium]|nr:PrgI family protein [Pseudonocardiaceae bacterium]
MTEQRRRRVRLPADIEYEDRILARLTARQVAILAVAGVVLWLVFMATRPVVPLPVFLGAAAPVVGLAVALAFGRRDGVTLDRLAWAAFRQARQPRRLVTAPDGVTPPPTWAGSDQDKETALPSPLRLPAQAIAANGTIDLGGDGMASVLACSTVSLALATDAEQEALVTGFGVWLNTLAGGAAQVLVRTEQVSLTPLIGRVEAAAGGLPHLALEQAAREHTGFLRQMAASTDLRTRQVLLILREPRHAGEDEASVADRVTRLGQATVTDLRAAGVTATVLDGAAVRQLLADVCDPYTSTTSKASTTDAVVTKRRTG